MIDLTTRTEYQDKVAKLVANRQWLEQNLAEIQSKYAGRWVAIVDQAITSSGDTAEEVREQSHVDSPIDILIMRVPAGEISKPI